MLGFEPFKTEVLLGTCWWAETVTRGSTFNVPLVQGIYSTLQRETSISLLFPGPKSRGDANSIKHECLHVHMHMVYIYFRRQFEAVPAHTDVTTVA